MHAANAHTLVTDLAEAVRAGHSVAGRATPPPAGTAGGWPAPASRDARWRRTSVRTWRPGPLAATLAAGVLRYAHDLCEMRTAAGVFQAPVLVSLAIADGDQDLASGLYEIAGEAPGVQRIAPWSKDAARASLLQAGLAEAPACLYFFGNLDRALATQGAAGLRHVITDCGAAATATWLHAVDGGLGACMTAGIIENELRSALRSDGLDRAAVVALCFGVPLDEGGDT